jgi:hypothetical protein
VARHREEDRRIVSEASETEEIRRRLASAWRTVGNRLIAEGYEPADVTATMLTVAVASWSGLRAPWEAAEYLRAIADRLEQTGEAGRTGDVAA